MFFKAMKRKDCGPRSEDMRAIVPLYNPVNKRVWNEIKQWEAGRGSGKLFSSSSHSTLSIR